MCAAVQQVKPPAISSTMVTVTEEKCDDEWSVSSVRNVAWVHATGA